MKVGVIVLHFRVGAMIYCSSDGFDGWIIFHGTASCGVFASCTPQEHCFFFFVAVSPKHFRNGLLSGSPRGTFMLMR